MIDYECELVAVRAEQLAESARRMMALTTDPLALRHLAAVADECAWCAAHYGEEKGKRLEVKGQRADASDLSPVTSDLSPVTST